MQKGDGIVDSVQRAFRQCLWCINDWGEKNNILRTDADVRCLGAHKHVFSIAYLMAQSNVFAINFTKRFFII